jgi:hypothetical protein
MTPLGFLQDRLCNPGFDYVSRLPPAADYQLFGTQFHLVR